MKTSLYKPPQDSKTPFFAIIREILGHLTHIRKKIWSIGFWGILYTSFIISGPFFYKILMDTIEDPEMPLMKIFIIITVWVVTILATIGSRYIFSMKLLTETNMDWYHFSMKTMQMMMQLPIDYHISIEHGEKQKGLDRASEAVWSMGEKLILRILPQVTVTIALIIGGLWIDPMMTGISLIFFPVALIGVWKLGTTAHTNQRSANKFWDKYLGRISDAFSNLKIIRIFSREEHEMSILDTRFGDAKRAQHEVRKNWIVFNGFGGIVSTLAQAVTVSGGIILYHMGGITLGTLLFFIAFTDRIYTPIFAIFESAQQLMLDITGYEKIRHLFSLTPERNTGTKKLSSIQKEIRFEHVDFSYPSSERQILSDISFSIQKGEHIALIGHTGSGKSTITQLLMRFYEPSRGTIYIDGTDIYEYTLGSYRTRFASVFQDTTLFNDTIRHNLMYVRDGITEADIEEACREANILDFIHSLPDGFETEVGERGLKLSGGEKQRLAIARAILANPEILILDEATSALDTKTEKLIQEGFDRLMQGRTSIIIAHRLSTIQHVDHIYLMDHGKIIAHGSHTELYERSPEYREMVDLQHDGILEDKEGKE